MKKINHNQLELTLEVASHQTNGVSLHSLINGWIAELMPDLLDRSDRSNLILRSITNYLSGSKDDTTATFLECVLEEDLYFCLIGFQSVLVSYDYNWNNTLSCFQQHALSPPIVIPKTTKAHWQ